MLRWKYLDNTPPLRPLGTAGVIQTLLGRRLGDAAEQRRFLSPDYERDLHDPFLFRDMETVVERIGQAKKKRERIGIFGDFDADGVTASVLFRETLLTLGIDHEVYIPHKVREGHGLNQAAVQYFFERGVSVMVTLDCGMMNHAEIETALEKGIDTIIIDHHHVPEVLPKALAIINPKLPNETYPFHDLCGAGTTFKVATALYQRYLPERIQDLKWLLDVAAIGTVADVMPLLGENRAIVKYGLIVLAKTRRIGLQELMSVGRIPMTEDMPPTARLIAFHIAPRINAASRMAHGKLAHDLLMERDRVKARGLALELEAYNVARQKQSQAVTELVKTLAEEKYRDQKFIFAAGPEYPLGIVGLVAGRVAHELGKPTCILQTDGEVSRGSFRSIPGLNIIEVLEQCGDMLEKFGGHDQAAGMTIRNEHIEAFYERFNRLVEQALEGRETVPELTIDLTLHPADCSIDLIRGLDALQPFGEGNPEPVFALEAARLASVRTVGKENQHWKLTLDRESGGPLDVVGWSLVSSYPDLRPGMQLNLAGTLAENSWNGRSRVQIVLRDIQPAK